MTRMRGDRWFYHPSRETYALPDEVGLQYAEVTFDSEGHALAGWFFPAVNPHGAAPKGTVVHCHGNGGNMSGHFPFIAWMPVMGWNVLMFDYRGFGQSPGTPTRAGTVADAGAAIDYVLTRGDVDASRVVLFGQSLGGAVGIVAAAKRKNIRGIVVEGAFADYQREAKYFTRQVWFMWGLLPFTGMLVGSGLDPIDYVGELAPIPTFFIGGARDNVCPCSQTIELYEAAGEPKHLWIVEDGEHTGAVTETNGEGMRRIDTFLTDCVRW